MTEKIEKWEQEFEKRFLDKSHSTWKYPSDIEAIYDYISTHFISKDEHKKILNSGHAMFEAGQRQVKEELREKIKNKLELHTHNSIPSYTASADEGCVSCIQNQIRQDILNELEK